MKIKDIFEVVYGTNLELNHLKKSSKGINFVSRTTKNNGVSAKVEIINGLSPLPAGLITVSVSGSVMEAFVQPAPFYSGRDVYFLKPKREMNLNEKLFYCMCLRANKHKYSYGRQANRTLKEIILPSLPTYVNKNEIKNIKLTKSIHNRKLFLTTKNWRFFDYRDLFEVKSSKAVKVKESSVRKGHVPLVSATTRNNSISTYIGVEDKYPENNLTLIKNGNGVGNVFYQPKPFAITTDVVVLSPKFFFNPFRAFFLIPLMRKEKYRFSYGRKWGAERVLESKIKLPVNEENKPDWEFMENYIKSLPYSKALEN